MTPDHHDGFSGAFEAHRTANTPTGNRKVHLPQNLPPKSIGATKFANSRKNLSIGFLTAQLFSSYSNTRVRASADDRREYDKNCSLASHQSSFRCWRPDTETRRDPPTCLRPISSWSEWHRSGCSHW